MRILVIDDNPDIHDDIRKVLNQTSDADMDDLESQLFGEVEPLTEQDTFEIDSAYQGIEGLELVKKAQESDRPYALAFVDIRMPPGWDGIETISRIWTVDSDMQVVICTAYSDYAWQDIVGQLGKSDNLVILKKPFDVIEVLQLTHALTKKWEMTRQARLRMNDLNQMVQESTKGLEEANAFLKQEIMKRARVENALRLSEERFSKAFELSPIPMTIINLADGFYVNVNRSFLEMTGQGTEAILGRTGDDVRIFSDLEQQKQVFRSLQENQPVRDMEAHLVTATGTPIVTLLSAEHFILGDVQHTLLIWQNITERLNLEGQLRQAQKMEAVGQLAAGIAHDFNNLLTVIGGYVDMQLSRTDLTEHILEPLRPVADAAERATTLTRQLLAFSRKQQLQPRVMDLNASISHLSMMLNRIIGENIMVEYQYAENLPAIYADALCIEQIIINLVVNARDAMPDGGALTLSTDNADMDDANIRPIHQARSGSFVRLRLIDTGIGMDEKTMSQIFEPFFTTKDVGKGTGMGLAMVYGLVHQHKGWVEVSSNVGEGSQFDIFLPVCQDQEEIVDTKSVSLEYQTGEQATILIVEDDVGVLVFSQNVLQAAGYQILTATDGHEALRIWKDRASEIDILFTDLMMPNGINGVQLAEEMLDQKPELKIIYTSGYSLDLLTNNEGEAARNLLQKPFSPETLLQSVYKVTQKPQ